MSGRRTLMIASAAASGASSVPLTLTAASAGSTVTLNKKGLPTVSGLQYRVGTSGDWSPYTVGTSLTLAAVGDAVQFRNTQDTLSSTTSQYVKFAMTGSVAASGNIMSMLNWREDCPQYCFAIMFSGCTALTQAPALPATTLGEGCYNSMFYGCTALTQAPALPATTLTNSCYANMFSGCTALTQAPALPATTLTINCYYYMFNGCSSLTQAPALPATTLTSGCYYYMFSGCTALTEIEVSLSAWKETCTSYWLANVSEVGTFIKPAALPEEYGADRIPTGWTVVNK